MRTPRQFMLTVAAFTGLILLPELLVLLKPWEDPGENDFYVLFLTLWPVIACLIFLPLTRKLWRLIEPIDVLATTLAVALGLILARLIQAVGLGILAGESLQLMWQSLIAALPLLVVHTALYAAFAFVFWFLTEVVMKPETATAKQESQTQEKPEIPVTNTAMRPRIEKRAPVPAQNPSRQQLESGRQPELESKQQVELEPKQQPVFGSEQQPATPRRVGRRARRNPETTEIPIADLAPSTLAAVTKPRPLSETQAIEVVVNDGAEEAGPLANAHSGVNLNTGNQNTSFAYSTTRTYTMAIPQVTEAAAGEGNPEGENLPLPAAPVPPRRTGRRRRKID